MRREQRREAARRTPAWTAPLPVREWMAAPAVTITAEAPVRDAIDVMRARRIRHLPVVAAGGRLVGIVTDRDLRQMLFDPSLQERLDAAADIVRRRAVREVMTWDVVTVRPETGIREAARLMYEQKIGALPVVDHGRVVGILTERDVLRAFEGLVRGHTVTVRPLTHTRSEGDFYEYGFPEPSWGEPWENQGGGH